MDNLIDAQHSSLTASVTAPAAEQVFASHHEAILLIAPACKKDRNLAKFPLSEGPPACLQVDKSDQRGPAISLLQLSQLPLLTHLSGRMFPFAALLPFPPLTKCPTYFNLWNNPRGSDAAGQPTVCRFASPPCPAGAVAPCTGPAPTQRCDRSMLICIVAVNSCKMLLSNLIPTPEGTLEPNQCFPASEEAERISFSPSSGSR